MTIMIIEHLIADPEKVSKLKNAVIILNSIDAFGALLDNVIYKLSQKAEASGGNSFEQAALRAAYIDGYGNALRDLYHFEDRFFQNNRSAQPRADFNALKTMYEKGDISKDEHDKLSRGESIG